MRQIKGSGEYPFILEIIYDELAIGRNPTESQRRGIYIASAPLLPKRLYSAQIGAYSIFSLNIPQESSSNL